MNNKILLFPLLILVSTLNAPLVHQDHPIVEIEVIVDPSEIFVLKLRCGFDVPLYLWFGSFVGLAQNASRVVEKTVLN